MNDDRFRRAIEEIKLRLPIEDVVRERVPGLRRSGALWVACCPFHDEKTPSFKVDPRRGTWHCFGACGTGGDQISFVQRFERLEFLEALELLGHRAGVSLPDRRGGPERTERGERLYATVAWARDAYRRELGRPDGARALEYLHGRGFEPDTLEAFGAGWAPAAGEWLVRAASRGGFQVDDLVGAGLARRNDRDRAYDFFRGRLMLPIADLQGRPVGFGGRTLEQGPAAGPKYVNTPETDLFRKSGLVYALDLALDYVRREGHLILVEGYTDVMAAHQAGLRTVAAVLGTATTEDHARLVRRSGARRITLVFDGDEAGRRATAKALHGLLPLDVEIDVVRLPGGQDPCDALVSEGRAWMDERLEAAVDWMAFLVEGLAESAGQERLQELDRVLTLVGRLARPLAREERLTELAERLGYPIEGVREAFESLPERRRAALRAARPDADERGSAREPRPAPRTPAAQLARRAFGELAGALLVDASVLPLVRGAVEPRLEACPDPDLARVLRALLELAAAGREPDASGAMTALGEDPARELVPRLLAHAQSAEGARQLIDGALSCLERLEAQEHLRDAARGVADERDEDSIRRRMQELYGRLRELKTPGPAKAR